MPTRKNTPFNVTLIGAMLLFCLFVSPESVAASIHSPVWNHFICHFHHANIFHFLANAWCLWLMRPSVSDMVKAYPLAVIASFCTVTPMVGISAVIYAWLGMELCKRISSVFDIVIFSLANLITIFIPSVAWTVHFAAFLLGFSVYMASQIIKHRN